MRVKRSLAGRRRHKKVIKAAKGYRAIGKRFKTAKQAVMRAGISAYVGRKLKKRQARSLWIVRINAAVREYEMSYSVFMNKLRDKNILINRKMLAELAVNHKDSFKAIVEAVK
ncbi:MAG: 50S ribosomal protein L20 [Candidatus Gracilibacteria bacterium]|nr:50S ribosomal protein L20 [Candidatus Gracilibacteria bacterium]